MFPDKNKIRRDDTKRRVYFKVVAHRDMSTNLRDIVTSASFKLLFIFISDIN